MKPQVPIVAQSCSTQHSLTRQSHAGLLHRTPGPPRTLRAGSSLPPSSCLRVDGPAGKLWRMCQVHQFGVFVLQVSDYFSDFCAI